MMPKFQHVYIFGLCVFILCISLIISSGLWSQEKNSKPPQTYVGRDVQILQFTSIGQLHEYMKKISASLGVSCKYCHNITAFEDPKAQKETTRRMMRMMNEINKNYFAESEKSITCFVCHQGRKHPTFSAEELKTIQEEEARKMKDDVF
ncbi:c-type cytochrome [bacterium]|nr:c-type cytochrome [bacterium]